MANVMKVSPIFYFESEGRKNIEQVIRVLKRVLKKRPDLHGLKIIVFTAEGQGPALAYSRLATFQPKIVAVTFPLTYSIKLKNGESYCPRISPDVLKFFKGVEIEVSVPPRLPFDLIEGMEAHNQQMRLVRQTIAIFGSGFELCLQAVMCACDVGLVREGEQVIAFSADTAGLFVASPTRRFMSPHTGLIVEEIFCKPNRLTISRHKPQHISHEPKIIEGEKA